MNTVFIVILISIFSISIFGNISNAGETEDDIKSFCKKEWGSDYEMQKYCIEKIHKGWRKISELVDRYGKGSEEYSIIGRCWNKWYPQLDMVEYCASKQISAYQSLK